MQPEAQRPSTQPAFFARTKHNPARNGAGLGWPGVRGRAVLGLDPGMWADSGMARLMLAGLLKGKGPQKPPPLHHV